MNQEPISEGGIASPACSYNITHQQEALTTQTIDIIAGTSCYIYRAENSPTWLRYDVTFYNLKLVKMIVISSFAEILR